MSRFWAGGSSSSESDSDSSDSYSSDDSYDQGGAGGRNQNKWAELSDDSSSEDEERVVKSGKERALETFDNHISNIRNGMKNRNFNKILSEYESLQKAMIKSKAILKAGIPRPLIRIFVDLEDYVKERLADKAAFKKLSASNGRSLNRLKLTLRKSNKPYEKLMEDYRKNPIVSESESSDSDSDDDDDDDSDSDDDDDKDSDKDSDSDDDSSSSSSDSDKDDSDSDEDSDEDSDDDDDDDDDDSDWGSDSSSSSSDSEDEGFGELKGRAKWLKKVPAADAGKKKKDKPKQLQKNLEDKEDKLLKEAAEKAASTKSIIPTENLTAALLNRKAKEISSSRGRRGTDNRTLLRQLEGLSRLSLTFGPRVEIPILMHVITAQFDLQRTLDDYMETSTWKSCAGYLDRIVSVLEDGWTLGPAVIDETELLGVKTNPGSKMKAAAKASADVGAMDVIAADEKLINPETGEVETEDERAERIRIEKEKNMTKDELRTIPVVGSLSLFLSRLEEEYTKSLQRISPHTPDYVIRLRDESKLVNLLKRTQSYYVSQNVTEDAALLAQLRVEHLYYKHDTIAKQVEKASEFYDLYGEADMLHPSCILNDESGKGQTDFTAVHPGSVAGKPSLAVIEEPEEGATAKTASGSSASDVINELCTYVYQYGTDREKTRALICHVYHHALHDRFLIARDLLLMSHLQDTISNAGDVSTMILFNRMMVNLGLAAFRLGRIWDAHQCLSEICSGRVRELLAQGVSTGRFVDKSAEQEKAEKRRQVPYHQHINLDLLEACHLISAMLLEVPNMVESEGSTRRSRVLSRTFRKHHDIYDRQVFTGPPEQTRDFVMRASKALMKGDWKTCSDLLTSLDVWKLFPGDNADEQICTMLTNKIKLEGLRTYLFTFSSQYDSLSLTQLCGMFDMTKNEVHSVVSKMMINRELFASWDQPTETIVLRRVEPKPLQVMALQFADKAASLVDANERLLDAKSGSYGYKDDHHWKGGDRDDYHRRGDRGGYHHRGGGGGGHRSRGARSGGGDNRRSGNRRDGKKTNRGSRNKRY